MSTQREAAAALATGERVWVEASTQPGTQGWGVVTGRIEGYDLWKVTYTPQWPDFDDETRTVYGEPRPVVIHSYQIERTT